MRRRLLSWCAFGVRQPLRAFPHHLQLLSGALTLLVLLALATPGWAEGGAAESNDKAAADRPETTTEGQGGKPTKPHAEGEKPPRKPVERGYRPPAPAKKGAKGKAAPGTPEGKAHGGEKSGAEGAIPPGGGSTDAGDAVPANERGTDPAGEPGNPPHTAGEPGHAPGGRPPPPKADRKPSPARMEVPGEFHPEGIAYDRNARRFFLGSLTSGVIRTVAEDGSVAEFVNDPDIEASVGIFCDNRSGRLLVAVARRAVWTDPSEKGIAKLAAYDLKTGKRQFLTDLGALLPESRHFANDITVDFRNRAYVTDTFAHAIYRVDSTGKAEVFAQGGGLSAGTPEAPGPGPNGIVYHPNHFLIVANTGTRSLWRIPIDNPADIAEIPVAGGLSGGPDGMTWVKGPHGDRLVVILHPRRIVWLDSESEWKAGAKLVRSQDTEHQGTTLARRTAEEVYALFGNIAAAYQADAPTQAIHLDRFSGQ